MKTYLVVTGDPVSQKNSGRRRIVRRGEAMLIPTNLKRARAYRESAWVQLREQWNFAPAITRPVVVEYQIYRSNQRRQDQGNAMEAIWDAMKDAGIVVDDWLIIPRAVGPLKVDPKDPRVELFLRLWDDDLDRRLHGVPDGLDKASREEWHHLREYRPEERINGSTKRDSARGIAAAGSHQT